MLKGEAKDRALWKLARVMRKRYWKGWKGTRIEAETREQVRGGAPFTTCVCPRNWRRRT